MIELLILAAAAKAAVPTVSGDFDCAIEMPMVIAGQADKMQLQKMGGIAGDRLAFTLSLDGGKGEATWPKSPVNVDGKAKVLATGVDAGVALFDSPAQCTFTDKGCATMLHYARQSDGTLRLMLHPTALISDKDKTTRSPFLVIVPGRCTPRKNTK